MNGKDEGHTKLDSSFILYGKGTAGGHQRVARDRGREGGRWRSRRRTENTWRGERTVDCGAGRNDKKCRMAAVLGREGEGSRAEWGLHSPSFHVGGTVLD